MKRYSPVIFGLLVAATLAVDAVAFVWKAATGDDPLSRSAILYDALVCAQLGVVAIWAVFAARRAWRGWIALVVAVCVAAVPAALLQVLSFAEACGIYGAFAAIIAAALWALKRTGFWQRLTGAQPTVWQFSIAHLLAAMTLVAVLIVSLRHSQLVDPQNDVWRFITLLTLGDVLIVLTTVVAWAVDAHVLPRLAATVAAAATLGAIEAIGVDAGLVGSQLAVSFERNAVDIMAYATILAGVIFIWLELVPIVPHDRRAASLPPAGADAS